MIGQTLGSYKVTEELGEGGMGKVYVALHALLGKKAAVKVLLPKLSGNQEVVERFFNEARAATLIKHRGIVDVFDFGYADDGSAYIVMEFLDGESLADRMESQGMMQEEDIVRLSGQIASALAAAHEVGIIHRDLKPDNVYIVPDREVTRGERAKVLDFGIAKLTGESSGSLDGSDSTFVRTRTGAVMGSPLYMAPEQCKGAATVDARADIYALGCVMYHMATERPPFLGEGIGDVIAKHIYETEAPARSFNTGLSRGLEAIIARTMQKSPDDRYQSMTDLRTALDRLAAEGSMPGPSVSPVANTEALSAALPGPSLHGQELTTLGGAAVGITVPPDAAGSRKATLVTIAGVLVAGVAAALFFVLRGSGDGDGSGSENTTAAAEAPLPKPAVATPAAPDAAAPAVPTPTPSESKTVKIHLESTPNGAAVYRKSDGIRLGYTPYDDELPRGDGEMVLILKKKDYRPEPVAFALSGDTDKRLVLVSKRSTRRSSRGRKPKAEPPKPKLEAPKPKVEPPKPKVEPPKPTKKKWGETLNPLDD